MNQIVVSDYNITVSSLIKNESNKNLSTRLREKTKRFKKKNRFAKPVRDTSKTFPTKQVDGV